MGRLKAIIFDGDGVLFRSMERNAEAYQRTFRTIGLEIAPEEVFLNEGRRSRDLIAVIAAAHGRNLTEQGLDDLAEQHRRTFLRYGTLPLYEGAARVVEDLSRASVKLALVTGNYRESALRNLGSLGTMFDVLVTAEDVTHAKPDPEPYRVALQRLATDLRGTLVIENAPLGIQSAKAAGLHVVAIASTLPRSLV
jgi:beta-phosphoglucomutase